VDESNGALSSRALRISEATPSPRNPEMRVNNVKLKVKSKPKPMQEKPVEQNDS
jgi:hypothetical protein